MRIQRWLASRRDAVFEWAAVDDDEKVDVAVHARSCDVLLVFQAGADPELEAERARTLARGGAFAVVCIAEGDDHEPRRAAVRAAGAVYLRADEISQPLLDLALDSVVESSRSRRALDDLQSRFALAVRGLDAGYWEWNPRTDEAFYSRRWREVLGFAAVDENGRIEDWFARVHPDDLRRVRAEMDAHFAGLKPYYECEHRVTAADGAYRWVLSRGVAQRDEAGMVVRVAGSLTDISEFRKRERDIREQSRQDALTGLPRREPFIERLARAVELSRTYPDFRFAVLLVEVDRLRRLNESIGQAAGDAVLALLARRIETCVDRETLVARYGGAKFMLLIENVTDPDLGERVATRLQDAVKTAFEIEGQPVYVNVSIGITSNDRGYERVEDVLSDVTAAASRARHAGAGRQKYSASMRDEALSWIRLEMALRQAVDVGEFELFYQPIISLSSGWIVAFESLIRWNHPSRGMIPPAEFIPVAESTGLILPIGRWALGVAARQLRAWQDEFSLAGKLAVSVNISGRQVADPELLRTAARVMEETELDPGSLKVELTESVVMENVQDVTILLNALRHLGIQIWIDDFGTGYSSLSYLHRFPVDGLKIDKAFVDALDGTQGSEALIRTIVSLASHMGVALVAEGIERKEQADQLSQLGCQAGQGYLFGRPVPAAQARELIARGAIR
jgi:diguanylate cyclase (GGDEF)-like protein/PAS domain S-box-containing protein